MLGDAFCGPSNNLSPTAVKLPSHKKRICYAKWHQLCYILVENQVIVVSHAMKICKQENGSIQPVRGHRRAFDGSLLALESRIMFDGAAEATASAVTTEQIAQSQAQACFGVDDATAADRAPAAPTGEPQPSTSDQVLFEALAAYDSAAVRQEILFVSTSVREYQQLLDGISPHVEVHLLDPARDGVEQMAEILAGRTGIDSIHLIGHGSEAEMQVGASFLTQESISLRYAEQFQKIGGSLSADADLLIYGCDFGRGEAGQAVIKTLATLTGLDVAASTDLTGHASLGGDWELESQTGQVETDVAVRTVFQEEWVGLLPTYTEFLNHTNALEIKSDANHGQTFIYTSGAGTYIVNQISLALYKESGAVAQTITVQLRDSWNGTVLGTATIADSTLTTSMAWYDLSFAAVNLNDGQSYTIRVSSDTTSGKVHVGFNSSGGYSGGNRIDTNGSPLPGEDVTFKVGFGVQYQAVGDTYIKLRSPDDNNNFGASTSLLVDRESTDLQRALLQFDLSSIPANTIINSATLQMQSTQIGGTLNISAYELLQAWTEGTGNGTAGEANWNERVTGTNWTVAGGSFNSIAVANFNTNATGQHMWDITSLVQGWVDGSKSNHGLMVASPDGGGNRTVTYDSSEGTTPPVLVINYSLPSSTAPVITNLNTDALAYNEGSGAVVVEQGVNATVVDSDSPDFDTGTLFVSFVAGSDSAEDVLAIRDQGTGAGQIGVSGSTVTYGGTTIGTVGGGSGGNNLVVTFNSNATPGAAEALIRNVTYENTDTDNPTPGARTVRFFMTDGDGGISGNHDTTVMVSPVNDAPVNLVPGAQTVAEDTALALGGLSVNDVDGNLSTVQLVVTNGTVTVSLAGGATISSGANGTTTLTLAGTQTQINAALGTLAYQGALNYTGPDTLTLTSSDTGSATDLDTVTITVNSVNDAPVITSDGGGAIATVNLAENQTAVTTITSTDVDGGVPTYSIVGGPDAVLFTLNGTTGALTFNAGPNFEAPVDAGANNVYNVTVQVADGNGGTDLQAFSIMVTDVNEALPPTTPPSLDPAEPGATISSPSKRRIASRWIASAASNRGRSIAA